MQELRAELDARLTYENGGKILFGGDGVPLNPRGRTGLRGRGLLGQWGANHAADPIVTRREPLTGTMQVLAIKRRLTGEWSLPGGMVKAGDSVSATVNRMLGLSNGDAKPGSSLAVHRRASTGREVFIAPLAKQKDFDEAVQALLRSGVDVYSGYVDDQRNTDNAWVESRAVHFHVCHTHRARTPDQQAPDSSATNTCEPRLGQCPRELGEMLPLQQPSSKASRRSKAAGAAPEVYASWLDANRELEPRYAEMVRRRSRSCLPPTPLPPSPPP